MKKTPLKRYNKKSKEDRKEERKDFPDFFKRHIEKIQNNKISCEECGNKLQGHVSEVAHVLPKQYFKSISIDDNNVLYLCGMYSENQCHSNFDNWPQQKVKQMRVFSKICQIYEELKSKITEKINYKVDERYTC